MISSWIFTSPQYICQLHELVLVNGCEGRCYERVMYPCTSKHNEKSFAEKLADELLKKHNIQVKIYARLGGVRRYEGGELKQYVNRTYHQEGTKLIVSTIGGTKEIKPYSYKKPRK